MRLWSLLYRAQDGHHHGDITVRVCWSLQLILQTWSKSPIEIVQLNSYLLQLLQSFSETIALTCCVRAKYESRILLIVQLSHVKIT